MYYISLSVYSCSFVVNAPCNIYCLPECISVLFSYISMPHPCLPHCFSAPSPFCRLSTRPWDPLNDLIQFEKDGCIQTKVRHRTPMVRSGSLISLSNQGPRRDNCKCQVGCSDQKTLHLAASAIFHATPRASSLLLLLIASSSLCCRHHCLHHICVFFTVCPSASSCTLLLWLGLLSQYGMEGRVRLHALAGPLA